jgi:hypothetical protein
MTESKGSAIAEAVSRWLLTAAARVRARVGQVRFVVAKWRRGWFSQSTSVSPAKTIHSTNFSILTIIRGRYSRPVVAAVRVDPVWIPTPNIQIERWQNQEKQTKLFFFFASASQYMYT